jgi:signal recognition particle receptor subunit beta
MVLFNHATREMTAKIVYYGAGLCGKTTNLLVIFDKLDPKNRGKMLSLATKTDRTLFFDLLPVDVGKVGPFSLKLQLYTVPGQVFYDQTRKLVLKGADAVVFVVDSQPSMLRSNEESFVNLLDNLRENQIDPEAIPIVVQYNKRDIPGVLPVDRLAEELSLERYQFVEASALLGDGVMETFRLISKITAKHLVRTLQAKSAREDRLPPIGKTPEPAPALPEGLPLFVPPPEERTPWQQPAVPPPPAPEPAPQGSDDAPFEQPEGGAVDDDYESVEEVSLESLLEGRDRPATFGGNVPLPTPLSEDDEIEILSEEHLVEEDIWGEPAPEAIETLAAEEEEIERIEAGGAPSRDVDVASADPVPIESSEPEPRGTEDPAADELPVSFPSEPFPEADPLSVPEGEPEVEEAEAAGQSEEPLSPFRAPTEVPAEEESAPAPFPAAASRVDALELEVAALRSEIARLRDDHESFSTTLTDALADLAVAIRRRQN